jgi:hypothetical protein
LKLTDLVPEVAEPFLKNELTVGHALLVAKLPDGLQKEALNQAFVSAWNDGKHERVLKPIASLQTWIEQHVFLQLDKVPFPKDDATLVPEAGSCLDCPILFPRKDARRVPSHWLKFGSRHSPITGGPRLAVNPPNALLNYAFALAESECRLALSCCGLDPGIGFVHLDTANRDSLALDLLETIRPSIEAWLLHWITRETLRRSDFFETGSGNCRLRSGICSQLSETAPTWGRLVAPWAEYVAQVLWTASKPKHENNPIRPTRLTQQHRTEAKGGVWAPRIKLPKSEHLCPGCGKSIRNESSTRRPVVLENYLYQAHH